MIGPDAGSLTDYTCAIRLFRIVTGRNTVVKSPTPANPYFEEKAGAGTASVVIEFISAFVTSSGLWAELVAAQATDSAELYFEWTPSDDTVSATNPKRTGYFVVTDLDSGAAIGAPLAQAKTFPARAISAPITA